MVKLENHQVQQNQILDAAAFKTHLAILARPRLFHGYLIVKEEALKETHLLTFIWENLKGAFGFNNSTKRSLIENKTIEFLKNGKDFIRENDQDSLDKVNMLAKKIGLISDNNSSKNEHAALNKLVQEIGNKVLKRSDKGSSADDHKSEFYKQLKGVPEVSEGRVSQDNQAKIQQVFSRSSKQVFSRSSKDGEGDEQNDFLNQDPPSSSDETPPELMDQEEEKNRSFSELPDKVTSPSKLDKLSGSDSDPSSSESAISSDLAQAKSLTPLAVKKIELLNPEKIETAKWKTAKVIGLMVVSLGLFALTYAALKYSGVETTSSEEILGDKVLPGPNPFSSSENVTAFENVTDNEANLVFPNMTMNEGSIQSGSNALGHVLKDISEVIKEFIQSRVNLNNSLSQNETCPLPYVGNDSLLTQQSSIFQETQDEILNPNSTIKKDLNRTIPILDHSNEKTIASASYVMIIVGMTVFILAYNHFRYLFPGKVGSPPVDDQPENGNKVEENVSQGEENYFSQELEEGKEQHLEKENVEDNLSDYLSTDNFQEIVIEHNKIGSDATSKKVEQILEDSQKDSSGSESPGNEEKEPVAKHGSIPPPSEEEGLQQYLIIENYVNNEGNILNILKQNPPLQPLFETLTQLVGKKIPPRLSQAFLEFALLNTEVSATYLKHISNRKYQLQNNQKELSKEGEEVNSLEGHFQIHVLQKLNDLIFQTNLNQQIDNIENLLKGMNDFHFWMLGKIGDQVNLQPILDSMREFVQSENILSKQPLKVTQMDQLNGFHFENSWEQNNNTIKWVGTFLNKDTDLDEKKSFEHIFDFTNIIQGTDLEEKSLNSKTTLQSLMSFIYRYCKSDSQTRESLNKKFSPFANLSSSSLNQLEGEWLNASTLQKGIHFGNLIALSQGFANEIEQDLKVLVLDRTPVKSLEKVDIVDEVIVEDEFNAEEKEAEEHEKMDKIIEEFDLMDLSKSSLNNERKDDLSNSKFGYFSKAFGVAKSVANSAFTFLVRAPSEEKELVAVKGVIDPSITMEDAKNVDNIDWVTKKYALGLQAMLENEKIKSLLEKMIKDESKGALKTSVLKLIQTLNTDIEAKDTYHQFLTNLRSILNSKAFNQELDNKIADRSYDLSLDLVLEMCRFRFSGTDFYEFSEKLIGDIFTQQNESFEGALVEKDFAIIKSSPLRNKLSIAEVNMKKLQGHLNIDFDPHLQGNTPFILAKVKIDKKDVTLVRMGTPTIETFFWYKAEINPEFKGYLQALKAADQKHLYISLQNDKKKMMGTGDESARNQAIKELQETFPETFFAVVLAQDSRFYHQKDLNGKPLKEEDKLIFIQKFYQELFGFNTGFYFPDKWKKDPTFKLAIHKLLNDVAELLYPIKENLIREEIKENLIREEKLDFIEIFYAYLSIFLIQYSKVDNANITCKDAIDRAGKLNSLVLKLIMRIQNTWDEPINKKKHRVLTHAPAFLVKAQPIIKSRRERLMSANVRMDNENVYKGIKLNQSAKPREKIIQV